MQWIEIIVGKGLNVPMMLLSMPNQKPDMTAEAYIGHSYSLGETDEFVEPTAFKGYDGMQEGDSVLTINFRSDRMREMVTAIADENFAEFERGVQHVNLATITEYDKSFKYPVMFKKDSS